ncbi:hypothetical protein HG536_0E03430 [Torulaspora globosa]|uniref:Uncharacterized protein n=1 Tax=Torulaspora globosa TaxID=48254 RepID=A0A7G3ZIU6_9SACH|nr:uncharacterized protein HG536_0E03430 [Torulaspora globosa]QLL33432.1 hypothetical protein HG536_0E03430 [Torulaspora globosa]
MSNFFRDSSMGFKPRSNIFSKLRIKEAEVHVDDSLTDADSSLSEDIPVQSSHGRSEHLSTTVVDDSGLQNTHAKFQLGCSTPKASKKPGTGKGESKDEFDLEITEVRDVLGRNNSNGKSGDDGFPDCSSAKMTGIHERTTIAGAKTKVEEAQCADTSSNDVLLEAFNNTQKICSNLKQELQRQQSENSKLKSQIHSYQVDNEKLSARFVDMKQLLTDLSDKSAALFAQKGVTDANLEEIKGDYERLKKKVEKYRSDITELKVNLSGLQTMKSNSDAELSNRAKEIDYLKRELNDRSGQLSEEKLKNSSLIQEIGKTRDGLKEFFSRLFADGQVELSSRFDTIGADVITKIKPDLESFLKNYTEESEKILTANLSNLSASFHAALQQSDRESAEILTVQLGKVQEQIANHTTKQIQSNQRNLLSKLGEKLASQDVHMEGELEKFYKEQQNLMESNGQLLEQFQKLTRDFDCYRNQLRKCEEYESRLNEFQSQITSLNLQKGQALSSLGVKEAQYEDLMKQVGLQNSELSKCKDLKNKLRAKVDSLVEDLGLMKSRCSNLAEENITLKANSENKIIVQGELLKGLQSENESLKQRNKQLDDMRKQFETDNTSHVDKTQRLNDHLQKLNVEMVQIKAHELELEEANRKMKYQLEQDKTSYEEATDDFKRLRQRVIVLEGEKQDNVREKIELQDKNDELRESIKILKQNLNKLQKLEPQIEKQDTQNIVHRQDNEEERRSEAIVTPNQAAKKDCSIPEKPANENDEFDLSSSLNDDLELTNPSPIQVKPLKTKRGKSKSMKPPNCSRKKLLLPDEDESTQLRHRWKKRRA